MEIGAMERSPESTDEFKRLIESLDEFRRPDTKDFIADVRRSGNRWLKSDPRRRGPWIEGFDFRPLGTRGLEEVRAIWGRDAALWGARLDESDLRASEQDLVRRRASVDPVATDPQAPDGPPQLESSGG
jgi:hypothetical protein